MASEQQKSKVDKVTETGEEEYTRAAKDAGLHTDLDDVMEEIDDVLEAHTEEEAALFVANFINRGGE